MCKYGEWSLESVKFGLEENISNPKDACEIASIEIFGEGTSRVFKVVDKMQTSISLKICFI